MENPTFAVSKQKDNITMKQISGIYRIADCEHWGDVENAKSALVSNNCTIVNEYWDGHDCGEAYIQFKCAESSFPLLYKKFGNSATFNADINDYIKSGDILPYERYPYATLRSMVKEMETDLKKDFEYRIPLYLWFEIDEEYRSTKNVVKTCLSYLKEPYEVIGYSTHNVDGCEYVNILIETTYKNLTDETIGNKGIGDYCLGNEGYLNKCNIYGECNNSHVFLSRQVMWYYSCLQSIMEKIHNGEDLIYKDVNYYSKKELTISPNEYFDSEGTFQTKIVKDEITYKLKDPRSW